MLTLELGAGEGKALGGSDDTMKQFLQADDKHLCHGWRAAFTRRDRLNGCSTTYYSSRRNPEAPPHVDLPPQRIDEAPIFAELVSTGGDINRLKHANTSSALRSFVFVLLDEARRSAVWI